MGCGASTDSSNADQQQQVKQPQQQQAEVAGGATSDPNNDSLQSQTKPSLHPDDAKIAAETVASPNASLPVVAGDEMKVDSVDSDDDDPLAFTETKADKELDERERQRREASKNLADSFDIGTLEKDASSFGSFRRDPSALNSPNRKGNTVQSSAALRPGALASGGGASSPQKFTVAAPSSNIGVVGAKAASNITRMRHA